jgi:hypothetical protein
VKGKIKELEIKLRKNIELYENSLVAEEKPQVKPDTGEVIRRRKGEPERRIFRKLNKQ